MDLLRSEEGTTYIPVTRQDVNLTPLGYDLSDIMRESPRICNILILGLENGDFSDIRVSWVWRTSNEVPDRRRC